MTLITIEFKYENMTVHDDKLKGCREFWRAAGLIVFVVGDMTERRYQQAENLVKNKCIDMHIPLVSLKKTGRYNSQKKTFKTETRRMF